MRAPGLGHLFRRGRTWWIQYCFRGQVYRESSGSRVRADAVKRLRARQAEMGRGRLVGPDVERTTFEDLAQILLDNYRVNGRKSLQFAEGSFNALRAFFGPAHALDITADRLDAYVKHRLAAGRRPATARNELAVLKRAFRLAARAGKAICPPFPTVHVQNARAGFFEAPELQAVLAHLPVDVRPVVEFATLTGWRKGEVLGLHWRNVDFTAQTVRLEPGTTKNAEGRVFPFAALPALADLLRRQREHTSAVERATGQIVAAVFHRRGKPIQDFRRAWARACRAAGVPARLFHDLRRTAVRNLERAGVSRSVAMKLTGHKTESIYRRYAIVAEADLTEGVKKLAALRADSAPGPRTVVPLTAFLAAPR